MSITSMSEQAILFSPVKTSVNMTEHLSSTRSPPVLIRTPEMMEKSRAILKMQTVSPQKVIIKILPTSMPQQLPTHTPPLTSRPSMPERLNTVPRFTETPCGQFNPEVDVYLDPQNIDNTMNGKPTDTLSDCTDTTVAMHQSLSQDDNDLSQLIESQSIVDIDLTSLATMNAADLVSPTEKPLPKINIQKANSKQLFVCLDDEHMSLITPETEKTCFEFLHSNVPPTASIIHDKDLQSLLGNEVVSQIIKSANILPAEAGNPFKFSDEIQFDEKTLEDVRLLEKLEHELTAEIAYQETVVLDHGYSAPKRKLSDIDDESTWDSVYPSSVASSSVGASALSTARGDQPKKKRQRGIYRLEDVTNEEERQNYLERRKKNNISSKASRANKKSYFNKLESNADTLESDNIRLTNQIATLESNIKEIKNFLINKFNTK